MIFGVFFVLDISFAKMLVYYVAVKKGQRNNLRDFIFKHII